jgi:hypothetical protein
MTPTPVKFIYLETIKELGTLNGPVVRQGYSIAEYKGSEIRIERITEFGSFFNVTKDVWRISMGGVHASIEGINLPAMIAGALGIVDHLKEGVG